MHLTSSFLTSSNQLSLLSTRPNVVNEAMKRAMEVTLKLIHARYVVDLFRSLSKLRIGTTKIEGLCRKVCDHLPRSKASILTSTVIRWKLQDAQRNLRKARSDNTRSWRRERPLLDEEDMVEAYQELWAREKSTYAYELRQKLRNKTNFLKCTNLLIRDIINVNTICTLRFSMCSTNINCHISKEDEDYIQIEVSE